MKPAHESIEQLVNGIVRCNRDLELEIENQFNQGVLLDECQPLKDKAFQVYKLRAIAEELIEAITSDDFDSKTLRENLVKINLQRSLLDEQYKQTEFYRILKKLKIT